LPAEGFGLPTASLKLLKMTSVSHKIWTETKMFQLMLLQPQSWKITMVGDTRLMVVKFFWPPLSQENLRTREWRMAGLIM
jgi:hypothetical protein